MRILVWQWGRRGAGPLVAAAMARELAAVPGVETVLSLSTGAELLAAADAPSNALPIRTYTGRLGFAARILSTPTMVPMLVRRIRAAEVDVALCAMPAPLDLAMAAALRRARVPFAVVVHDAQLHPGDAFPLQMPLQRVLLRRAGLLFALSSHVAGQLRGQGLGAALTPVTAGLPPFVFGPPPPPVGAHGGRLRLLSFGRLLPYKGLDLLADAMALLAGRNDIELRVVGAGPESAALGRLRTTPNVTVENRWVPESELGTLLGWADALVLTHREASQSGVAAAAIAARRWIVSTRVGGLEEQLQAQDMAMLCTPEPASVAATIARLVGRPTPDSDSAGPAWSGTAIMMAARLEELLAGEPQAAEAGLVEHASDSKRLA